MYDIMKLDWHAMKCYHVRLLIIPIYLLLIGWVSPVCLIPLAVFLLFSFSINSFYVEERGDLNRFYLTLPIKRSQVVLGRYLLSLTLFAAGELAGLALMPLANLFALSKWYPDLKWCMVLLSSGFLFYALLSLSMYPVLFKLGYQKGKIWGFYIPAALTTLIYIIVLEYDIYTEGFLTNLLSYASDHLLTAVSMIIGLGAGILAISCLLSIKTYSRRDF